jgi:hypothetical protein
MNGVAVAHALTVFFRFVFTPALLVGTMGWSWKLTEEKTERAYAFWLGIFVAILVIVLNLLTHPQIEIVPDALASFSPDTSSITRDVVLGGSMGGVAMALTRFLDKTKMASLIIAAVSSASLIGIYYVFIGTAARDDILVGTLSFVIGAIAFRVFAPGY